jgi:hypothetical protein
LFKRQVGILDFEVFEKCPAELPGGDGLTIPRYHACFSGKAAGCGLDRFRVRRCGSDHPCGGFDFLGPASVDEPLRLGHEGVIGTCGTPGRRCTQDAAGMPETSVTGRRGKLVKPSRDGGAIGELDRFSAPFFHRNQPMSLKILGSKNENCYAL